MFSAISHDLRTPLARIRFKMERWPGPLSEAIDNDVEQMNQMIGSVLGFIRDGQASSARQKLMLTSLLEVVVDDAAEAGQSATIGAAPPLTILGDPAALMRLFSNLVGNAIKYAGAVHVEVSRDGGDAIVRVEDDGPGLPESELERVFEPFYRADPARNLDASGVGLGLAIARSIAREHGGDIHLVRRTPGLAVVVRLPLANEPPRVAAPRPAESRRRFSELASWSPFSG
jgi:signal transduction histidine kinase